MAAMTIHGTPSEHITAEVTSWPAVEAMPGDRGEWSFRVGGHEIGHLHGDHALHLALGRELGARLRDEGRVGDHPVFPGKPGIAARRIANEEDVEDVIAILRLSYDRTVQRYGLPVEAA